MQLASLESLPRPRRLREVCSRSRRILVATCLEQRRRSLPRRVDPYSAELGRNPKQRGPILQEAACLVPPSQLKKKQMMPASARSPRLLPKGAISLPLLPTKRSSRPLKPNLCCLRLRLTRPNPTSPSTKPSNKRKSKSKSGQRNSQSRASSRSTPNGTIS